MRFFVSWLERDRFHPCYDTFTRLEDALMAARALRGAGMVGVHIGADAS